MLNFEEYASVVLPAFTENVLKVKRLVPEAVLPAKANSTDAGYDCVAIDDGTLTDSYIEYGTGIAVELPEGYHCELFPRSSISKYHLILANSVGLVDQSFRGELKFRFKICTSPSDVAKPYRLYKKGDKIGQIVIRKTYSFPVQEVYVLSETDRGTGGFGSTGI
jgi:dUTP pyrophosphatase